MANPAPLDSEELDRADRELAGPGPVDHARARLDPVHARARLAPARLAPTDREMADPGSVDHDPVDFDLADREPVDPDPVDRERADFDPVDRERAGRDPECHRARRVRGPRSVRARAPALEPPRAQQGVVDHRAVLERSSRVMQDVDLGH